MSEDNKNTTTQASVSQVRDFFGMSASDMLKEWKQLSDEEKTYFKTEVAKVINS